MDSNTNPNDGALPSSSVNNNNDHHVTTTTSPTRSNNKSSNALSWQNITYTVKKPDGFTKHILNKVSGQVLPGEVSAILGPSGCGKTSLLNILADRISTARKVTGDIYVSGKPREAKSFRAVSSYVAQEDSLMGSFTVLETMRFSAKLSLPSYSAYERELLVQETIDSMGLRICVSTLVGDMFRKGISGGQKRRLSIAVELLSRPSILLLDEPTSGLDSASTLGVMQNISQIAKTDSLTVLCTIHQPSSVVYELFSSVTFLSAGHLIFTGPSKSALTHFAEQNCPCPTYTSLAEHILTLINTDFEGYKPGDVERLAKAFQTSASMLELHNGFKESKVRYSEGAVVPFPEQNPVLVFFSQFTVLVQRQTLNNIRNPGIFWVRLGLYSLLSLMMGTMYMGEAVSRFDVLSILFGAQAFFAFLSISALPAFIEAQVVFERERVNNSLNVGAYVVSNFFAALPGLFILALVSTLLIVLLAGFSSIDSYFLTLFLSLVISESLMHVLAATVSHYIIGMALGAGTFGMFMLCSGFFIPRHGMPSYWLWGYYLAFHTYAFENFVYGQFKDDDSLESQGILSHLDMQDVDLNQNFIILTGYALALQCAFFVVLYHFHTGRH